MITNRVDLPITMAAPRVLSPAGQFGAGAGQAMLALVRDGRTRLSYLQGALAASTGHAICLGGRQCAP